MKIISDLENELNNYYANAERYGVLTQAILFGILAYLLTTLFGEIKKYYKKEKVIHIKSLIKYLYVSGAYFIVFGLVSFSIFLGIFYERWSNKLFTTDIFSSTLIIVLILPISFLFLYWTKKIYLKNKKYLWRQIFYKIKLREYFVLVFCVALIVVTFFIIKFEVIDTNSYIFILSDLLVEILVLPFLISTVYYLWRKITFIKRKLK